MTTLMIKDLAVAEELDSSAMFAVRGGRDNRSNSVSRDPRTDPHVNQVMNVDVPNTSILAFSSTVNPTHTDSINFFKG